MDSTPPTPAEATHERRYDHLIVEPYDNALRFTVTSKSRTEIEHVVDLGVFAGNGACSCEHFVYRLKPKIMNPQDTHVHRCQHIQAARSALADAVIDKLRRL